MKTIRTKHTGTDAVKAVAFRAEIHRWLVFYALPVLIGLGGIIYSQQILNPFWRTAALVLFLTLPVATGGNMLSRYHTTASERIAMLACFLILLVVASYSLPGIPGGSPQLRQPDPFVINLSRALGILSLSLGLFVVLVSIIRTDSGAEEIANRFKFLAEHISEGLILSQSDGTILLVNQQVLDMFGMTRETVIGRDVRQIASSFGLNLVVRHLEDRAEGISSEYEIVWEKEDIFKVLLISGMPIVSKRGRHLFTLATVRDITEQRRTTLRFKEHTNDLREQIEQQSRKMMRSEKWLRHLLFSMNEGFLTVDSQYRIQMVNNQAAALLRSNESRLTGRNIFDYVTKVGHSRLLNLFMLAMGETSDKGLRHELEFMDGEGNPVPVLIGVVYLNDPETENAVYSITLTPIADLQRMQQQLLFHTRELERANEELRSHDRAKDGFLSNVTHELRTPLTTIRGYIEMFLDNSMGDLTDDQRYALTVMDRNSKHLLNSINEMIEFSRMQIRGIQAVVNVYDAAALVREAAAAFLPSASEKRVEILTQLPDGPLFGWGDREKLHQVLGILLNNAIKFTEQGGTITLSVHSKNDASILFTVSDTGIGIDPVHHEKIFERFFQVDKSKARKYEGSGIGLAIARTIIEAHEGSISIQSEVERGSTFTITLPGSLFSGEVDPDLAAGMETLHVLIIEENEERRSALRSFAPLDRARVSFCSNGYEIGRLPQLAPPDLILINDAPADVAGETSLRFLRQHMLTLEAPVIVFTNERHDVLQRLFSQETHLRFILKPFKANTLVRQMKISLQGGVDAAADAIEDLIPPPAKNPLALVMDTDPGFLEWVEQALKHQDIDARCVDSPNLLFDSISLLRPPNAIFIDGDMSARQLEDVLLSLRSHASTADKPLYLFTSIAAAQEKMHAHGVSGILHKPFPISDMTERILSKDRSPVESSGLFRPGHNS